MIDSRSVPGWAAWISAAREAVRPGPGASLEPRAAMMWMGAQAVLSAVEMGAPRANGRRRRVLRRARKGMAAVRGVLRGQEGKEARERR